MSASVLFAGSDSDARILCVSYTVDFKEAVEKKNYSPEEMVLEVNHDKNMLLFTLGKVALWHILIAPLVQQLLHPYHVIPFIELPATAVEMSDTPISHLLMEDSALVRQMLVRCLHPSYASIDIYEATCPQLVLEPLKQPLPMPWPWASSATYILVSTQCL